MSHVNDHKDVVGLRPTGSSFVSNPDTSESPPSERQEDLREPTLSPVSGASSRRPARRVTANQLDLMRRDFSDLGLSALQTLRDYRLMQVPHLARFLYAKKQKEAGERSCRRLLKRLHDKDLVRRLDRRIGGMRAGSSGHVYAVSPLGHRLLRSGTRKRWGEPSLYFVNHTLAIAEVASQTYALAIQAGHATRFETEPAVWRRYQDALTETWVKPDLYTVVVSGEEELHWFVEVDLHTESLSRIERKCQAYRNYFNTGAEQATTGVFPKVLWTAPDEQRATQLTSVLGQSRWPPGLFALALAPSAASAITTFNNSTSDKVTQDRSGSSEI